MNVSEFLPVGELQTIGRAELRAVLRALNEVRMLRLASIMWDSKHIVDGCSGQAIKWKRNEWRTTSGPVKHTDLWKQILILLEVYATHVRGSSRGGPHEESTMDNEYNFVQFCFNNTRGRVGRAVIEYTSTHTTTTFA